MKNLTIIVLLLAIVFGISACQETAHPEENAPAPVEEEAPTVVEEPTTPKITVSFDGQQCLVSGPDSASAGRVMFGFENQSSETARIGIAKLDDGLYADDAISLFERGSSEIPNGAAIYSGTKGVLSGKTLNEQGLDLEPGEYMLSCVYVSSGAQYPGLGLSISE
ncbi:MAG: hypothetical protein ISR58_13430 [Anaerolineales bacterium]|nr:hypothetical protein [FCB group bacterium]MBL6982179.1 hypothetical protein [Anaerolineales bacterium]